MPASASIVEECLDNQCTITFGYTGQTQMITFPASATNIRFEVLGAQGGKTGGGGGRVTGAITEPFPFLYITVGGAGESNASAPGGFNGGGTAGAAAGVEGSGGGASDIRTSTKLSSRIVVAGGGGGRGSGLGSAGGAGGGLIGVDGKTGQGGGGLGGSQESGGLGGLPNGEGIAGTSGEFGVGGTGGSGPLHGGGGGGGGYFGGGGGGPDADWCCTDSGGGGGGSSYTDLHLITDVLHSQGVRQGAGQVTIIYQLGEVSELAPPKEEPANPPVIEEPLTTEPTVPNPPEPESVNPGPSESEQQVSSQPEPTKAPSQEPVPVKVELAPEPIEDTEAPIVTEIVSNEPRDSNFSETKSASAQIATTKDPIVQDEILQQPSNLRQAAQSVVVPVQNKKSPWSSNSLFAGLIGLGVFALIAGWVVARRGVPGAIAS